MSFTIQEGKKVIDKACDCQASKDYFEDLKKQVKAAKKADKP